MIDEYFLNLVAVLCPENNELLTSWTLSARPVLILTQHFGLEALESTTSEENASFLTPMPLGSNVVKSISMFD